MPCFRTTPEIAKKVSEGYEENMREADFVGRVSRKAWMIPTWELVPSEDFRFPVRGIWDHPSSVKRTKRILKAMLRCKPLPPIVVERSRFSHGRSRFSPQAPIGPRTWEVIDGHHRASIAMVLGITHVPAIISTEEYEH